MKIVFALCAVLLFTLTSPRLGYSAFIENYSDWRELSASAKAGFVMGYADKTVQLRRTKDDDINSHAEVIGTCLFELQLTDAMLVDAMDRAYGRNQDFWSLPAAAVLFYVLRRICLDHINAFRRAIDLPPLQRYEFWR